MLLLVLSLGVTGLSAEEILVRDVSELKAAESALPGDRILLADGVWRDMRLKLRLSGTSENPITIRPANRGKATIEGESALEFVGDHVVLDGLIFQNGSSPYGQILRIEGSNFRITRCEFLEFNPEDSTKKYDWLALHGRDHRVDRCRFAGQNHPGVTLSVWLADEVAGRHLIERNHFGPRASGVGNGFETIRVGDSTSSEFDAECIVRKNLFERCDGELETVSNKSCRNEYLDNTFLECAGCLTLRQGDDCIVRGNVFLGGGKKHTGGIRILSEGHRIENNHIEGTTGRANGAISLGAGNPNPKSHEYAAARNVVVSGNSFVDVEGEIFAWDYGFGERGRSVQPTGVEIAGNWFGPVGEKTVKGELGEEIASWSKNRFGETVLPEELRREPLTSEDTGPNFSEE